MSRASLGVRGAAARPRRLRAVLLIAAIAFGLAPGCSKENNINSNATTNNYATVNETTMVVGPSGATVGDLARGYVDIPPGALTKDTEVKVAELSDPAQLALPTDYVAHSPVFVFEPHGQTFALGVVINIIHQAGGSNGLELLRADPGGTWAPVTTDDMTSTLVQRTTKTFSLYVVATKVGVDASTGGAGGAPVDSGGPTGGTSGSGGASGASGGGGTGGTSATGGSGGLDAGCKASLLPCADATDTSCCSGLSCQYNVTEWDCCSTAGGC